MTEVVVSITAKLVIDSLLELFPFWMIVIEWLQVFYWGRTFLNCWFNECFCVHFSKDSEIDFSNIILFMSFIKMIM